MGVKYFKTERNAEKFAKKARKIFKKSKISVQGNAVVFHKK